MPNIKTDRDSIIGSSIRLFKVNGYYNTTMADIGKACGLIKGSIYHHFSGKEDLALECLRYIQNLFDEKIFSIAYEIDVPPQERLRLFMERVDDYFANSEGGCLLGNFALEVSNNIPSIKKQIIEYFDSWEAALYEILRCIIGEADARQYAVQIVAGTQGCVMLMRLHNKPNLLEVHRQETLKLLFQSQDLS